MTTTTHRVSWDSTDSGTYRGWQLVWIGGGMNFWRVRDENGVRHHVLANRKEIKWIKEYIDGVIASRE